MVQIACALNPEDSACPVECRDTVDPDPIEVKAGNLNVSLNSDTAVNWTQIPMVGMVRFALVDFRASSSDVSLKTVELSKVGLAAIPSTTRVWFEKDGIRISGKAAFTSEGNAVISFAPAFVVKAGKTESLDLYVDLNTTAGQDFQFKSLDVASTALNTNGSFTTPTLRTANYTVAPVDLKVASIGGASAVSENGMELWAFSIENKNVQPDTRDVKFKSITLRQDWNGSLSNLSKIVLERNGEIVSSNPVINGRDVTFSVMDTIKNATTATYYIKAIVNNVDNQAGDTYKFTVRNTSDLNAAEIATSFRSTVTLNSLTVAYSLHTYTIEWWDLTFTRNTNVALSSNYAAGTTNVVLMQGTIATKAPVTLEDPTVLFTTDATNLSQLFSVIYLQIGSSTFSYSPVAWDVSAAFLWTTTINSSANVKMYGTLKDTAPNKYVKFDDLRLGSFARVEYVSNGNTVGSAVGTIAWVTVTVEDTALNVTRIDGLWSTTIAKGMNNFTVYKLNLSSTQWNWVRISRATFDVANTVNTLHQNNVFLTLYVNWVARQTKTVTAATTVMFDGFNETITSNNPVTLEVKANFAEAFNAWDFRVTLNSLLAVDSLTSNAITSYNKPVWATFTIGSSAASIASSDSNPLANLYLSPSVDNKLVAFRLTAANDNVRLYDVALDWTNLDKLNNFRLTNASWDVIATATTVTSTSLIFSNISNAPIVEKDKSSVFFVIANANTSVNKEAVTLNVKQLWTNVKASNWSTVAVATTYVAPVAQVSTYTPTLGGVWTVYTITVGAVTKTFTSVADTAKEVVEWLVAAAGTFAWITVTEDDTKVILTANVAGTAFTLSSTNGSNATPTPNSAWTAETKVASRTHMVAENTIVLAKSENPSKLLTTSALRFTVTAAGKNSVTLNSINFNNLLAGYDTTNTRLTVYKDSIAPGNIAYQASNNTIVWSVALTANNTVDAGSTVTYIVALENTVINPALQNQDWSVSITNLVFDTTLNANLYNNVAQLPMTEVK
jgi:hypothetical protein